MKVPALGGPEPKLIELTDRETELHIHVEKLLQELAKTAIIEHMSVGNVLREAMGLGVALAQRQPEMARLWQKTVTKLHQETDEEVDPALDDLVESLVEVHDHFKEGTEERKLYEDTVSVLERLRERVDEPQTEEVKA